MIKKTIIVAVCVSLLGSCEQTQNNPNTAGGAAIGGLLGAAGGAVAAKKTGSEVVLPAGTQIGFTLNTPVDVTM